MAQEVALSNVSSSVPRSLSSMESTSQLVQITARRTSLSCPSEGQVLEHVLRELEFEFEGPDQAHSFQVVIELPVAGRRQLRWRHSEVV